MSKLYRAIGLMSGTSMDGIDLAFIESDGKNLINRTHFDYLPYSPYFKTRLSSLIYNAPKLSEIKLVENELTLLHANFVNEFLAKNKINKSDVDLISFHGHTIFHDPQQGITWQIGNGHLLANKTGIDVVADFRTRDVTLGGQGAPLVPIYHFYLFYNQPRPCAILNIGGISNITYFCDNSENEIEAFDTCFGNAPLDDLVKKKLGFDFDKNGDLAASGKADLVLAEKVLENEIFNKKPPKSFDRDDFAHLLSLVNNLKTEDALATLVYIHARALQISLNFFPNKPQQILVCGGGRKNSALMQEMKKLLPEIVIKTVEEVEGVQINGDAVEAEAFAFLGIRNVMGLPISFHKTTGVETLGSIPAQGGVLYKASKSQKQ